MSSKVRKYDSGYVKRKKKQRVEKLIQSQRGALDKFITKEIEIPLENQNEDICLNANLNVDLDTDFGADLAVNLDANVDNLGVDLCADLDTMVVNTGDIITHANINHVNADHGDEINDNTDNIHDNVVSNENDDFSFDIYDPRYWNALDSKMIDVLVINGPKINLSIQKGPKDKFGRRFLATCYYRVLPNGEKCFRDWLVYSKELDKIFCFCCKIFKKGCGKGQLVNEGFMDWAHISSRLRDHETSLEHVQNMATWYDLRLRLQKNQTIDEVAQKQIRKEKKHWKKVLFRIISIVKFLSKHTLAFRGSNARLYQNNNGNFLGLIEMLAEFDPIIQEHVHRITTDELHFHYLGPRIQNELILLLAAAIKSEIKNKIKEAKYFSVILDCTPDISHQEQMSLILRYVDVSSNSVSIEESFLGFLEVNDTTGQGLFNALQNELKTLELDIDDVRGQSYDNGSNMKGKNQGVQKRLLDINSRAFHTSCASHSLNLTLCDMANTCGKARDFFGVIQRIYTIFANSTKRWEIFKDNVQGLTVKSLSSTRWESRIDSVKAIRFQVSEIREALLQVGDNDNDSKIRSEAKSLAQNELGDFEFLVSIVIWYEVLYAINIVSKHLQSKDMLIDVAIEKIKGLISFFKDYRNTGFLDALEVAKKISIENNINPIFPQKRVIRRKKHFDENENDTSEVTLQSAEDSFKVKYFLFVVDQAIASLTRRFEQYQEYETLFGFLFTSEKLCSLDDMCLKSSCSHIETSLKNHEKADIDANELYMELKLLQNFLPKRMMRPIDILKYLKRMDCFPNTFIVYRILLTIPVTVASAERSFSKLKLLKSYMRSTMTQERLNGLAMLAIENDLIEKIDHERLIEDFISNNARRMLLFK